MATRPSFSHSFYISQLATPYPAEKRHYIGDVEAPFFTSEPKVNGFFGSNLRFSILANETLEFEAGACCAGTSVTICAQAQLNLGLSPMKLYAPTELNLASKSITIGDNIEFVTPSANIHLLLCKRLTLVRSEANIKAGKKEPDYFTDFKRALPPKTIFFYKSV